MGIVVQTSLVIKCAPARFMVFAVVSLGSVGTERLIVSWVDAALSWALVSNHRIGAKAACQSGACLPV